MDCQSAHTWCEDITWENVSMQLIYVPLITQGAVAILIPLVGTCMRGTVKFSTGFTSAVYVLQIVLSLADVVIWANRTYSHRVTQFDHHLEIILCYFFSFMYLMNCVQFKFSKSYAWQATSICDVITISSVLCEFETSRVPWIGWGYLRTFRALIAYERLEKTGILKGVNEMTRMIIISMLRTWALTICLGGTVKQLEILGDPPYIAEREKFIVTGMGEISFAQTFYYMVVTMSTVGYGDYSPSTVLNRFWIIICIAVGVISFGIELETLSDLLKWQHSGGGKYRLTLGQPHVVVLGGGIARPSPLLSGFFKELYAESNLAEESLKLPEVLMMSVHDFDDDIKEVLEHVPEESRHLVKYFVGNPMAPTDLERVKVGSAQLVYIIPDTSATDRNAEDEGNILRALAVKRSYPKVVLSLILLMPRSVEKAVNCGIRRTQCCSLNNLKSALLSTSCLCRGWTPLVVNLVTSSLEDDDDDDTPWFTNYKMGCEMSVYSFAVRVTYHGDTFVVFVQKAYREGVLPIGFIIDGQIVLNPVGEKVKRGRIVIAIAISRERLKNFEDDTVNWRQGLLESLESRNKSSLKGDPAVAGADDDAAEGLDDIGEDFNDDACSKYNKLAEKIAAAGSHIILALLAEDIWEQARSFVKSLRSPMLPLEIPIVVLVPTSECVTGRNAREVFSEFSNVGFIAGTPARLSDLQKAGISQARCTVILAGGAKVDPQVAQIAESEGWSPEVDVRMADTASVIALTSIEKFYEMSGGLGRPIIAEILNHQSLRLINMDPPYLSVPGAGVAAEALWNRAVKKRSIHQNTTVPISQGTMKSQEILPVALNKHEITEKYEVEDMPDSFYLHPRFASGGLYVMGCFGALVAETYYNPGILEIMRSLILSVDTQTSCPWCVTVPEKLVGRQYGDLVSEFIHEPWFALCLGLYRQRIPGYSSASCYVITNPSHSTTIQPEDRVIALGPKDFGKKCLEKGLLKPQQDAPRPEWIGAMPMVVEEPPSTTEDPSAPLL